MFKVCIYVAKEEREREREREREFYVKPKIKICIFLTFSSKIHIDLLLYFFMPLFLSYFAENTL